MDEIYTGRIRLPSETGTPAPCFYYNKKRNVQPSNQLTFLFITLQFCKVFSFFIISLLIAAFYAANPFNAVSNDSRLKKLNLKNGRIRFLSEKICNSAIGVSLVQKSYRFALQKILPRNA